MFFSLHSQLILLLIGGKCFFGQSQIILLAEIPICPILASEHDWSLPANVNYAFETWFCLLIYSLWRPIFWGIQYTREMRGPRHFSDTLIRIHPYSRPNWINSYIQLQDLAVPPQHSQVSSMVNLNASRGPIPCRNMMGLQKNGTCHEAIISHKILVDSIFGQTHIDRQIDKFCRFDI